MRGPVTYSVFRHGRIMVGSDTRLHPAAGVGCFQFSPYSRFPGFANIPCRAWGHGELGPPPFPGYRPAWYIQKGNTSALQNTAYCCSIRAQRYPINYRTPRVHERPQCGVGATTSGMNVQFNSEKINWGRKTTLRTRRYTSPSAGCNSVRGVAPTVRRIIICCCLPVEVSSHSLQYSTSIIRNTVYRMNKKATASTG